MEMQVKTTVTCHYTLTGMVKIKHLGVIAHANKNVKQLKISYTAGRNSKSYRHSGKQFLIKLTGIYPATPLMYLPLMKLIFTRKSVQKNIYIAVQ